jgi:hypothetical protein
MEAQECKGKNATQRADSAREKTLQIIEQLQSENEQLKAKIDKAIEDLRTTNACFECIFWSQCGSECVITGAVFWCIDTLSWEVENRISAESYEILASDNDTLEVIGTIFDF